MTYNTLYTIGYTKLQPVAIQKFLEEHDAVLVDVRYRPYSRNHKWNKKALIGLLGERYIWAQTLGNVNYKDGPIQFNDLATGVKFVRTLLEKQPVVLLCVCANINTCHRLSAANAIADNHEIEVIHLSPQTLWGARRRWFKCRYFRSYHARFTSHNTTRTSGMSANRQALFRPVN